PPVPQGLPDPCLRELQAVLDEELQRLPENHRQPLLLCYFEGLTQEEAAQQLGWPRGTLKRRLERGRELLKGRLTRRGLTLGAALCATLSTGAALAVPLPAILGSTTVRAAVSFAARQVAPAAVASAHVLPLAAGVLNSRLAAGGSVVRALVRVFCPGARGVLAVPRAAQSPADRGAVAPGAIPVAGDGEKPAPKRPPEDPPPQPEQSVKSGEPRGDPV